MNRGWDGVLDAPEWWGVGYDDDGIVIVPGVHERGWARVWDAVRVGWGAWWVWVWVWVWVLVQVGWRWDDDGNVVVGSDCVGRDRAREAGRRVCVRARVGSLAFGVAAVCVCEGAGVPARACW